MSGLGCEQGRVRAGPTPGITGAWLMEGDGGQRPARRRRRTRAVGKDLEGVEVSVRRGGEVRQAVTAV